VRSDREQIQGLHNAVEDLLNLMTEISTVQTGMLVAIGRIATKTKQQDVIEELTTIVRQSRVRMSEWP
jgi:hypothetical protein